MFGEVLATDARAVSKVVEWLGDTGASRHVCNDLSLMWDVRTREKPIVLRQLVGELHVYTTSKVKLEWPNLSGRSTVVSMLETCYISEAKVNLFSLQKLRKALYVIEQQDQLVTLLGPLVSAPKALCL